MPRDIRKNPTKRRPRIAAKILCNFARLKTFSYTKAANWILGSPPSSHQVDQAR